MGKKNRGSQALRLHKKQQELKEKERQAKAEAFLADYHAIVKKHGIDWTCELHFTPQGLTPRLRLQEVTPPQVTSWPEAQRQNLETRKECEHSLATPNDKACESCGLETNNWGAEGKGVTEEYETKKQAEIDEAIAKQNAPKQEEAPEEEPAEEAEPEAEDATEEPQEEVEDAEAKS